MFKLCVILHLPLSVHLVCVSLQSWVLETCPIDYDHAATFAVCLPVDCYSSEGDAEDGMEGWYPSFIASPTPPPGAHLVMAVFLLDLGFILGVKLPKLQPP